MSSSSVYVLVAHGSRDPRSQLALDDLLVEVRACLAKTTPRSNLTDSTQADASVVAAAALEFAPTPLPEAIAAIVRATGARVARLVPLFLQAGVHAREDVPAAANIARELLRGVIDVEVLPPIGSYPAMEAILAAQFARLQSNVPNARRLLVAHGSRRPDGNDPVAKLAARFDATVAFWAIAPDLETQVAALAAKDSRAIAIAPYFLFPGSITDAIAARITRLQASYPQLSIALAPPLNAIPQFSQLIVDLCCS
ncbi:MAG: sirohydrochlorin chelatase [Cyanobacteria bacterium J06641_5]